MFNPLVQGGRARVRVREPGDGAQKSSHSFPGHAGPTQADPGTGVPRSCVELGAFATGIR